MCHLGVSCGSWLAPDNYQRGNRPLLHRAVSMIRSSQAILATNEAYFDECEDQDSRVKVSNRNKGATHFRSRDYCRANKLICDCHACGNRPFLAHQLRIPGQIPQLKDRLTEKPSLSRNGDDAATSTERMHDCLFVRISANAARCRAKVWDKNKFRGELVRAGNRKIGKGRCWTEAVEVFINIENGGRHLHHLACLRQAPNPGGQTADLR
ncbi:hypothetical protein B0O99DRAFT_677577 [Bisporella sp. PMI_857]|nr:hypothetical protein B0O99DRAFT_677577 [Bisporella sp. PMI_857]